MDGRGGAGKGLNFRGGNQNWLLQPESKSLLGWRGGIFTEVSV
jgi:hypothetical protein